MKKTLIKCVILIMTAAVLVLLAGCGDVLKGKTITLPSLDGGEREVKLDELKLTKEQKEALNDVAEGAKEALTLLKDNLFSKEELMDLGLLNQEDKGKEGAMGWLKKVDLSNIKLDDLNLDALSEGQVEVIKGLLEGKVTLPELVMKGELSMKDLKEIGLLPEGAGQPSGHKENSRTQKNDQSSGGN